MAELTAGKVFGFFARTAFSYLISSLFAPKQPDQEGPRLDDLQVQASSYGNGIPVIYGTMQLAGNIVWLKGNQIDETRHKSSSGGKGGGGGATTTTYSYSATFAVMFGEGEIVGIRKILGDSVTIYDISDTANGATLSASNEAAKSITIYSGSSDQLPDPIIEAEKGTDTPAYRNRFYIVFEDLQLEKFGNRIPNLRAEVIAAGSETLSSQLYNTGSHDVNYEDMAFVGNDNGVLRLWDRIPSTLGGEQGKIHLIDPSGNYLGFETAPPLIVQAFSQDSYPLDRTGYGVVGSLGNGLATTSIYYKSQGSLPAPAGSAELNQSTSLPVAGLEDLHNLCFKLEQDRYILGVAISADRERMIVVQGDAGGAYFTDHVDGFYTVFDAGGDVIETGVADLASANEGVGVDYASFGFGNSEGVITGMYCAAMMENDYRHVWSYYAAGSDTAHVWEIQDGVMSLEQEISSTISDKPFQAGSLYANDGVMVFANEEASGGGGVVGAFYRLERYGETGSTLSSVVADICDRAGLSASEYDVTALTDSLDGYAITRPISARSALQELQSAYVFDAVESDDVLKFVKRGGSSVATIAESDLGASSGESVPVMEIQRAQESELPIEVNVQYISPELEYQPGNQRSRRVAVSSVQNLSISLAVSMSDNKAKQLAEIIHYGAWAEREQFSFNLPPEYAYLEPTDIVTVTANDRTDKIRITSIDAAPGGVISVVGVSDRAEVYSSSASGAAGAFPGSEISLIGPTRFVPLDLPMLTTTQDQEAFYFAVSGYLSGWNGAAILKSIDGGSSYANLTSSPTGATIGVCTDSLGDARPNLWDRANTVNVRIYGSNTLSSDTEANVLDGANIAAIGLDGAYEIIQWTTATLEADGSYTLSGLLRARFGTENHTGSHVAGDSFVVLESGTIGNVTSDLNVERHYKAVSFGNYSDDSIAHVFTNNGVRLKPYAPYLLKAVRNAAGDITFTWQRRSRRRPSQPFWDIDLDESSESYELDIMSGSPESAVRTLTATSETVTYTAAQQVTDFGSTQSSVNIELYQLSASVGRGEVLEQAA